MLHGPLSKPDVRSLHALVFACLRMTSRWLCVGFAFALCGPCACWCQVLEMAVTKSGERKDIPWLTLPGYPLFLELYAPLLQFSLFHSCLKAAKLNDPKKAPKEIGDEAVKEVRVLKGPLKHSCSI